jgi:hypothetical protein
LSLVHPVHQIRKAHESIGYPLARAPRAETIAAIGLIAGSLTLFAYRRPSWRLALNIGDQASDLAGGHAAAGFLLPNPMYSIP